MSDLPLPIGIVIGFFLGYAAGLQAGRKKGPLTKEEMEDNKMIMKFTIVDLVLLAIGGAIAILTGPSEWPVIAILIAMTIVFILAGYVYTKFWRKKGKKKQ